MPAYVKFVRNGTPIRGSVPSGVHAGWIELAGIALAPQASGTPPKLWLLTRRAQSLPPLHLSEITEPVGDRNSHTGGVNALFGDGSVRTLSHHPGGANFTMADGSVRTVSSTISGTTAQPGARSSHPGGIQVGMGDGSVRTLSDVSAELDFTSTYDNVTPHAALRAV